MSTVRLDARLKRLLEELAKLHRRSLAGELAVAVEAHLQRNGVSNEKPSSQV